MGLQEESSNPWLDCTPETGDVSIPPPERKTPPPSIKSSHSWQMPPPSISEWAGNFCLPFSWLNLQESVDSTYMRLRGTY